jgi:hypothetical protein
VKCTGLALQHVYPQWEPPEDDPSGEIREVWRGIMRIVRSRRRMLKLRKRGVAILHLGVGPDRPGASGPWAWFVSYPGTAQAPGERRHYVRKARRAQCTEGLL